MAGGRPTKFTPEIQQRLIRAIRAFAPYEVAAEYAGISYRIFRYWMVKGMAARSGPYFEFWQAIDTADAQAQLESVALIYAASRPQVIKRVTTTKVDSTGAEIVETTEKFSRGDWRARAWLLEFNHPERWSLKSPKRKGQAVDPWEAE
ncbi:hypothetical protein [Candidatus Binatus sp.]|jgi:hypothetical protein|uniref:hypothetical protein n=1 Tax=Candidatus Binatus sp. TaxID=2811406 RepID=UPI003BCDD6B2